MSDLRDAKLIVLSKTPQHPLSTALQSGFFKQVVETSLATIACVLAAEGMGIAIVDPFSASEFVGRNLVLRRIEPSFTIGTAVIYARGRRLSAPAREFLDEFLAHTRSFLEKIISRSTNRSIEASCRERSRWLRGAAPRPIWCRAVRSRKGSFSSPLTKSGFVDSV
jgi:hypothetical protein